MSQPIAREVVVEGQRALVLENAALRVTVMPDLGGHVHEIVDRAADRDVLWHNPRTAPRPAPYGAFFDDWWSGGWDEIFPSGDRGTLHDEPLPYMGEMWCVPWEARHAYGGGEASITAVGYATVAPARMTRTIRVLGDAPVLRIGYRIDNLDVRPLPYTWGIHPAFAVTPAHRIDLPARQMLVGVSSDPSMGEQGWTYTWPILPDPTVEDGARDMRLVRPRESAVFAGHWATDLASGWLALTDTAARRGVAMTFDVSIFRHAWLWQVYGGWRGHHHVALEPWTSHPQQVEEAVVLGQARVLAPGESIETAVAFTLHEGLDAVASVDRLGELVVVR